MQQPRSTRPSWASRLSLPSLPILLFPARKGVSFHLGDVRIYLISSENPETSIYKFVETRVETRGEGLFLFSLRVDNLEKDMQDLAANGVRRISDKPLPYSSGRANFGHPKSLHGVQIEFIQPDI